MDYIHMAHKRPNKRQRRAIRLAREQATIKALARSQSAEAIPKVRSNTASWNRVPRFAGVGYQSGYDTAQGGSKPSSREIHIKDERDTMRRMISGEVVFNTNEVLGKPRGDDYWQSEAKKQRSKRL